MADGEKNCKSCEYWVATGTAYSGLGWWFYEVGTCKKKDWDDIAFWRHCYDWKKKKGKRNE